MLEALLWVGAVVVVVVIALGATPVQCEFSLSSDPDDRFRILLKFLGGLTPGIDLTKSRGRRKKAKKETDKTARKDKRRRRKRPSRVTFGAISDVIREVLACIRFSALEVEGKFGTGDPAETGQLYGYLSPIIFTLGARQGADILIEPVFDEACFQGRVSATLEVVPFELIPPLSRFGWRMIRR